MKEVYQDKCRMEHEGIEEFVENEFLFTNQIFLGKNCSKTSLSSKKEADADKMGSCLGNWQKPR